MYLPAGLLIAAMILLAPGGEPVNPWKAKVPPALKRAADGGPVAIREAFDVTWRADDWQAGLTLAKDVLRNHPNHAQLNGPVARALWRAGLIEDAERVAAKIRPDTDDRIAVSICLDICLAQGDMSGAGRWADRLEELEPRTAEEYYRLFSARYGLNRMEGLAALLRKAERVLSEKNGYPEIYLGESVEGVAPFFDAVGTAPLNQIKTFGAAPMTPLVALGLPSCEVMINGHGPYRLVIDTGGSIMLSLDTAVAEEVGLKSLGTAMVRGVSGKQPTEQTLIDELRIGGAVCRRVVTRVFDVRSAVMGAADGIIGTGIFTGGRMTLDFVGAQLVLSPSRAAAGVGQAVDLRIVGDAKLVALVQIEGRAAAAFLDTGADAVAVAPSRLREIFPDADIQTLDLDIGLGVGAGPFPEVSLNPGVSLAFAGRKFPKYSGVGLDVLDTTIGPFLGVRCDMLIGMPAFREMRSCTVDYPRCKMWIDWLVK